MLRRIATCLPLLLAGLLLLGTPQRGFAQAKSEEIKFDTFDGVEIKGTFYPGGRGNKSPVVMFLHEFGGDRQKGGWDELAQELVKKGYAVLSFDFRGHNDSTTVNPAMFWTIGANKATFRPGKNLDKISHQDIAKVNKGYFPMLVNDIAAARRYLEVRNDAGDCNLSNLILVGAKEGAALGSLWIAEEWQRPHLIQNPINPLLFMNDPKGRIEGIDIAAAIWLSIPEKLSGMPISGWLRSPIVRDKVPMAFFYGEKDELAKKAAEGIYKTMKTTAKSFEATRLREKKNTQSAGRELLGKKGLGTEEDIVSYLDTVMDKRGGNPWSSRDIAKAPQLTALQIKNFGFNVP